MERIKLFENNDMKLLEQDVNKFLSKFSPLIIVKDIRYEMICQHSAGNSIDHVWTAMVRYGNNIPSSISPKEIELYDDGRPIFEAINNKELDYAIALYADEADAPYIVRLPKGTKSVREKAFYGNRDIEAVLLPNSVKIIEKNAFDGCSVLTSIEFPNSVESIGNYALCGCSGLTSITIPDSVTSIGHTAFGGCSGLNSITIPNSVTSIGDAAFSRCI